MKKIDFKKIKAENFVCFGDKGIEINFQKYGNIVLIKGKNLDTALSESTSEAKISSNGCGKSSIPEILVYGLFGKTIKKPKKISHKDLLNHTTGKKMRVEIEWDQYKVLRTRKPDGLRLWKSAEGIWDDTTEITLGTMASTQKSIEDILGLSYETFVNIVIFTDDNSSSFLECDAAEKRQIVENLLSLEKYRTYNESAKKLLKEHKDKIKSLDKDIEHETRLLQEINNQSVRYASSKTEWEKNKKQEIKNTELLIEQLKSKIENYKVDNKPLIEYENSQKLIPEIEQKLLKLEEVLKTTNDVIAEQESKISEIVDEQSKIKADVLSFENEKKNLLEQGKKLAAVVEKIKKLEPGVTCDHCFSIVDSSNYAKIEEQHQHELKNCREAYKAVESQLKDKKDSLNTLTEQATKLQTEKLDKKTKVSELIKTDGILRKKLNQILAMEKPILNDEHTALLISLETLQKQLLTKEEEARGSSPYDDLIVENMTKKEAQNEVLKTKTEEVKKLNDLTKYYDYWTVAFGDAGIRRYIIDEIIPALNKNIEYWLQFLIDNKLSITFNNELEEHIEKYPSDGNPYIYEVLSNGQRRRINLALSQAFAHVMSLNTGKFPSLVFLDEVTTNIDQIGVQGIYKMICEISKEKQVFVTTHDQDLLELLNGCENIGLTMKNGISTLDFFEYKL